MSPASPTDPLPLPDGIHLRLMKASDMPDVRTLHANLLPTQYPPAFFIQLLLHPRYLCLVATHEDAIVAFASAVIEMSHCGANLGDGTNTPAHVTLLTLGVKTAFRRRGIGRALVHAVARRLRALGSLSAEGMWRETKHSTILVRAEVAHSNTSGRCFYSCLGMNEESVSHLDIKLTTRTQLVAGLLSV
ncbi:acyl-CoA N-acyltransferase [Scleroderma citrinum]